jgi:hypothetical protein
MTRDQLARLRQAHVAITCGAPARGAAILAEVIERAEVDQAPADRRRHKFTAELIDQAEADQRAFGARQAAADRRRYKFGALVPIAGAARPGGQP